MDKQKLQTTLTGKLAWLPTSEKGRVRCPHCKCILDSRHDRREDKDGNLLYSTTIWCVCPCHELYNRDGSPKTDFRIKLYQEWGILPKHSEFP